MKYYSMLRRTSISLAEKTNTTLNLLGRSFKLHFTKFPCHLLTVISRIVLP